MIGRRAVAFAVATLFLLGAAGGASAESLWAVNHPRRHEVNLRLWNQNARIHEEVREGEMSRGEAAQLHREHRTILREERAMAWPGHGHITKREMQLLNHQENGVSRQIGR